jgi:hypothetical protein
LRGRLYRAGGFGWAVRPADEPELLDPLLLDPLLDDPLLDDPPLDEVWLPELPVDRGVDDDVVDGESVV